MSELKVEVEAAEVGLDSERLKRIDAHFARYVADGRLAGWLLTVRRHGRLAYVTRCGSRDLEAGLPVTDDTVWRIYSMTKPITSVAAMMLYEEGALALTDPVSAFIPSFGDVRVYTGGSEVRPVTAPATSRCGSGTCSPTRPGSPTASTGCTRWTRCTARRASSGRAARRGPGARACDLWAGFPLLFQPGTEWNYSVATDVLGRVVEVASGQRLDEFFTDRIFRPLGMTDTAFGADPAAQPRLAALYSPGPDGKAARLDALGAAALKQPLMLSGGGGLVSTAADYDRFTQMLLHRPGSPAGELAGARLLSPRTVGYMARNHLPGAADLETFGRSLSAEAPFRGVGFGLGFAVLIDPVPGKVIGSAGELSWGGAASTAFWVDQEADLTVSFFTQLLPSSTYPIRPELRQLVYQALTD